MDTVEVVGGPRVSDRLAEIEALPPDWMEAARKPSKAFLRRAESAIWRIVADGPLGRPHLYPTPTGGVQAEWDATRGRIEIEIIDERGTIRFDGVATWEGGDSVLERTSDHAAAVMWLSRVVAETGGQA